MTQNPKYRERMKRFNGYRIGQCQLHCVPQSCGAILWRVRGLLGRPGYVVMCESRAAAERVAHALNDGRSDAAITGRGVLDARRVEWPLYSPHAPVR